MELSVQTGGRDKTRCCSGGGGPGGGGRVSTATIDATEKLSFRNQGEKNGRNQIEIFSQ